MFAEAFARKPASYDILREIAGYSGRITKTGKSVTVDSAIEVSAVIACARVRSNGIAQVPLKLMRQNKDGRTKLPAIDHSLYKILSARPNDWQTSFEYRQTVAMHFILCGNHYSFINRSNRSGIMELIPFTPGAVTVKRADDLTLTYEVRAANGSTKVFPAKAIWHVKGPSWNTWMGLEGVRIAREAIGLSMATEESQARMHKRGVRPSGTYSVEGTLKDDQYKSLKKWIDDNYAGPDNAGSAMLMDRSAKWLSTQMTGVDSQHLETRKFQVEEVCRHFNVNPILIFAESKNTTYASAEQMFLAHVVHTLSPDYTMLEQSIDANLLTDADRDDGLYSNFVDEGLLRGSMTEKHAMILADVNGGLIHPNEGRALMDLNPDADPASDKLRTPANITGTVPVPEDEMKSKAFFDLREELNRREEARPAHVINVSPADVTVNINEGAVRVDSPVTIAEGAVRVESPVQFAEGAVIVEPANVDVTVNQRGAVERTVTERDKDGLIVRSVEKPLDEQAD